MCLDRTTAMFSATFPPEIQRLAQSYLRDYKYLTVGRVGGVAEGIMQQIIHLTENDKFNVLLQLIEQIPETELVIIFTQTKAGADRLSSRLTGLGAPATSIHGDLSQKQRETSLANFKSKRNPILVATDVSYKIAKIETNMKIKKNGKCELLWNF
mgnify:CR=1 FL=1